MAEMKKTFLYDGYQAKPGLPILQNGYQASGKAASAQTAKPTPPKATSVVHKPKE